MPMFYPSLLGAYILNMIVCAKIGTVWDREIKVTRTFRVRKLPGTL